VKTVAHIRDAQIDEARTLEELQRRSSMVWEQYRDQLVAHPDAIELPVDVIREQRVRVAIAAGRTLGFSVVRALEERVSELDALFVEPGWMYRGVGRTLMDDVIASARASGVIRLEVTAKPAVGFYEKIGFVAVRPVSTQFGPAVRMHLELRVPS